MRRSLATVTLPKRVERLASLLAKMPYQNSPFVFSHLSVFVLFIGIGDIIEAIVSAAFGIFEKIVNTFADEVGGMIADPLMNVLLYTPLPEYCPTGDKVSSCSVQPKPAIVTKPDNGAWPAIWDLYWGRFFIAALILGLVLYMMANLISTIPFVSPQLENKLRGGFWRFLVALGLGWPLMIITLFSMDVFIQIVAPPAGRLEFWITTVIATALAAIAISGPLSILMSVLSTVKIGFVVATILVYLARILYLMFGVAIAPFLILGIALRIPMAESIAKTLLSYWVKLGIAPAVTAAIFHIATLIMVREKPNGGYEFISWGFGGLGAFGNFAMGLLLPIVGLGGFYFVGTATMPTSASLAMGGVANNIPGQGKAVADLKPPRSDKSIGEIAGGYSEKRKTQKMVGKERASSLKGKGPTIGKTSVGSAITKAASTSPSTEQESVAASIMSDEERQEFAESNMDDPVEFYEQKLKTGGYAAGSFAQLARQRLNSDEHSTGTDNTGINSRWSMDSWSQRDTEAVEHMTQDEYDDFQKSDYAKPSNFMQDRVDSTVDPRSEYEGVTGVDELMDQRGATPQYSNEEMQDMYGDMSGHVAYDEKDQKIWEKMNPNEKQEFAEGFESGEYKLPSQYLHKKVSQEGEDADVAYAGMNGVDDFLRSRDVQPDAVNYEWDDQTSARGTGSQNGQYTDSDPRGGERESRRTTETEQQQETTTTGATATSNDPMAQEFTGRTNAAQSQSPDWISGGNVNEAGFYQDMSSQPGYGATEEAVWRGMSQSERHQMAKMAADPESGVGKPTEYLEAENEVTSVSEFIQEREPDLSGLSAESVSAEELDVEDLQLSQEKEVDDIAESFDVDDSAGTDWGDTSLQDETAFSEGEVEPEYDDERSDDEIEAEHNEVGVPDDEIGTSHEDVGISDANVGTPHEAVEDEISDDSSRVDGDSSTMDAEDFELGKSTEAGKSVESANAVRQPKDVGEDDIPTDSEELNLRGSSGIDGETATDDTGEESTFDAEDLDIEESSASGVSETETGEEHDEVGTSHEDVGISDANVGTPHEAVDSTSEDIDETNPTTPEDAETRFENIGNDPKRDRTLGAEESTAGERRIGETRDGRTEVGDSSVNQSDNPFDVLNEAQGGRESANEDFDRLAEEVSRVSGPESSETGADEAIGSEIQSTLESLKSSVDKLDINQNDLDLSETDEQVVKQMDDEQRSEYNDHISRISSNPGSYAGTPITPSNYVEKEMDIDLDELLDESPDMGDETDE